MKRATQHRLAPLSWPEMAPFAGLFLVISCFFMLVGILKEPAKGVVALRETPYLAGNVCFNVPDHIQIHVCLTASGRLSFSVSDPALQQAILEQVSKKYGVHFSAAELAGLRSTSFVAVRLQGLPRLLATSSRTPNRQQVDGDSALTQVQLLDCIMTARMLSPTLTRLPSAIYLSINAQTKSSLVMRLVKQLQQRKLNRLFLLTHCYS